jgi:hypothetical protein
VQAIDPKKQQRIAFAKPLQLHAVVKEGGAPLVQNAGHIQVALRCDKRSAISDKRSTISKARCFATGSYQTSVAALLWRLTPQWAATAPFDMVSYVLPGWAIRWMVENKT